MLKKRDLNFILVAILITIFMLTVGCKQESTTSTQNIPDKQQPPQATMFFSDDFSQYNRGSSPDKWNSIMEDKLQANVEGTAEKSGKYGKVINVKGRILTTGTQEWEDYIISLDFKINTVGENTGPEVAFYVSSDSKNYYIISSYIGASGTEYTLYKVENGQRNQLKKRANYDLKIDDDRWHTLELNTKEGKLSIDDTTVLEFETDGQYTKGGIGLATNPYASIYFDNIVVIGMK